MKESAFPTTHTNTQHGLTKREYIAIEAMKALIDSITHTGIAAAQSGNPSKFSDMIAEVPSAAFAIADEMLAESNKSNE